MDAPIHSTRARNSELGYAYSYGLGIEKRSQRSSRPFKGLKQSCESIATVAVIVPATTTRCDRLVAPAMFTSNQGVVPSRSPIHSKRSGTFSFDDPRARSHSVGQLPAQLLIHGKSRPACSTLRSHLSMQLVGLELGRWLTQDRHTQLRALVQPQ